VLAGGGLVWYTTLAKNDAHSGGRGLQSGKLCAYELMDEKSGVRMFEVRPGATHPLSVASAGQFCRLTWCPRSARSARSLARSLAHQDYGHLCYPRMRWNGDGDPPKPGPITATCLLKPPRSPQSNGNAGGGGGDEQSKGVMCASSLDVVMDGYGVPIVVVSLPARGLSRDSGGTLTLGRTL
jgi:hypothetical protein